MSDSKAYILFIKEKTTTENSCSIWFKHSALELSDLESLNFNLLMM